MQPCPCGSTRALGACCGPYLDGETPAPTAEALMRSRYSAFVLDRRGYLLQSWHPSTRPLSIDAPLPGRRYLGLEVKRALQTGDDSAVVDFVARSKLAGRAQRLHETSRFVREGGRWFYLDGEFS